MRAYYYSEDNTDKTFSHDSGKNVSQQQLEECGVYYFQTKGSDQDKDNQINSISVERKYNSYDIVRLSSETLDIDDKLNMFFDEHLHEDEEIRYILEGSGYFDIRNLNDTWIRIVVEKNDLIILPAGIFHRFTLDSNRFIVAKRLFKENPSWIPISRKDAVENSFRNSYLISTQNKA
ncbi:hypothetical protein BB561_001336 [Smittium simulii]|uniref:Acireductone dioxygenase n=1 Tax=Smittium simulii TaxID=133385 RepID=A0A2T9YV30_9FUNG|nr:hypothetical protein BB561_001336 [Smittium simulii]